MDADFSTHELQYQTSVLRNARIAQDPTLEPWDTNPEVLKAAAVARLQRIAGFSPHGGLSYGSGWEYLIFYNTLYVLEAPYENTPDLFQLVLTFDATFAVRYLAAQEQSHDTLLAAAFEVGAVAMRSRWRTALDTMLEQSGYSPAFRSRYTLPEAPILLPSDSDGPLYKQDEPPEPGVIVAPDILSREPEAGPSHSH